MENNFLVDQRDGQATTTDVKRARAWLIGLAEYIDAHAVRKHALFLVATVAILLIYGYGFGTFDQSVHIPALKAFADPSLFPGDSYLDLRLQHYSFFWMLFAPFYGLGILELAVFLVHLIILYLTLWMLWTLSEQLFHNPLTNLISLFAFVLPHIGFGGWPLFEWSLLNRTFVLPFTIAALILFLRGRIRLAFVLLGLMYNLHVLSVNFALALILFVCVLEWRKIGWKKIAVGLALFVVAALPVLIWKFSGPGGDLHLNPEWFDIISRGMLYNEYAFVSVHPHVLISTLSGLGTLGLFLIGRRSPPVPKQQRVVDLFILAAVLVLIVQVIVVTWLPITLLVEFQLMRVGIWVTIFGILYFANYLARRYQARTMPRADWSLLAASFLLTFPSFAAVPVWGIQHLRVSLRWRRVLGVTAALGAMAFGGFVIFSLGLWQPAINIYPPETAWHRVQFWARDQTPKDAVFITPPQIWWLFTSDWRVFSERSTVVTWSELLEVGFSPNYLDTWMGRFNELAPGALPLLNGNPLDNVGIVANAFYSLGAEDLQRVGCKYHASYLVVEKPHHYNFTVVYQNDGFLVYALPLNECPTTSSQSFSGTQSFVR